MSVFLCGCVRTCLCVCMHVRACVILFLGSSPPASTKLGFMLIDELIKKNNILKLMEQL